MPSPRLLRDAHTMKHKSTWRPIFSKPLLLLLLPNNDLLQQFEDYVIELQ